MSSLTIPKPRYIVNQSYSHLHSNGQCNFVQVSTNDPFGVCVHSMQVDTLTHEMQESRKE